MKQMKKFLALSLVAVMLFAFTACGSGPLEGTYSAETFGTGITYTFSGDAVKMKVTVAGMVAAELEGTYEVGDGTITLTFGGDEETAKQYSGTFEFAADEEAGTVKIGLIDYKKEA